LRKIDLGFAFKNGWQAFTRNFVPLAVAQLITTLLSMTVILIPIMWAGMFRMAIKSARGQSVEVGEVFSGFSDFGRYFVGGLLYLGIMIVGILACCIGIFPAMGLVLFLFPLMVDKGYTAGQAYNVCWDYFKIEWIMLIVTAIILAMFAVPQQIISQIIMVFVNVLDPVEAMIIGFTVGYGSSLVISTIIFPLMYTVYASAYMSVIGEHPGAAPAGDQFASPAPPVQQGGQDQQQAQYQPPQQTPEQPYTKGEQVENKLKYCKHCGAPLKEEEMVCPGCGENQ